MRYIFRERQQSNKTILLRQHIFQHHKTQHMVNNKISYPLRDFVVGLMRCHMVETCKLTSTKFASVQNMSFVYTLYCICYVCIMYISTNTLYNVHCTLYVLHINVTHIYTVYTIHISD